MISPTAHRGNHAAAGGRRAAADSAGDQVSRYGTAMADPWNYAGPVTQLDSGAGVVTLVDESTFAISGGAGDIVAGGGPGPVLPGHPDPVPVRGRW